MICRRQIIIKLTPVLIVLAIIILMIIQVLVVLAYDVPITLKKKKQAPNTQTRIHPHTQQHPHATNPARLFECALDCNVGGHGRVTGGPQELPKSLNNGCRKICYADFSGDVAPKRVQFGNRQKCRSNPSRLPSSKFLDSTPSFLTDFGGRKTESVLGQNPHTVSIFGSPKTSLVTHGQPGPKTAPQNRRL